MSDFKPQDDTLSLMTSEKELRDFLTKVSKSYNNGEIPGTFGSRCKVTLGQVFIF